MARITVEDCLDHCENRFALVHITAKRAKDLYKGVEPMIRCKNREIVTALREIADGRVGFISDEEVSAASPAPSKRASKK